MASKFYSQRIMSSIVVIRTAPHGHKIHNYLNILETTTACSTHTNSRHVSKIDTELNKCSYI